MLSSVSDIGEAACAHRALIAVTMLKVPTTRLSRKTVASLPSPALAARSSLPRTERPKRSPLLSLYASTVQTTADSSASIDRAQEAEHTSPSRGAWRLRRQLLGLDPTKHQTEFYSSYKAIGGLSRLLAEPSALPLQDTSVRAEAPEVSRVRQRVLGTKRKAAGHPLPEKCKVRAPLRLRGKQRSEAFPLPGAQEAGTAKVTLPFKDLASTEPQSQEAVAAKRRRRK
eukprot:s159_g5.t2